MHCNYRSMLAVAAVVLSPAAASAQGQPETVRAAAGGGISVSGWKGVADPGGTVDQSKLSSAGDTLKVTTGPAITYWNPANTASGNYTVKGTFTEPKYMNLNSHPHPYGIVIGGNDMGTPGATYLYCAAYGRGTFIVRGFGPAPFQVNGRGEPNPAVHSAAAGASVTQEIAMSVKGDSVSCAINGTKVGTWAKSAVVGAGKLKSTDGVWGIRFAHNTEGTVTGLSVTKN
jgi:hypothetical protein